MEYNEIIASKPVVLVEFYATWCPHCKRMMPVVEQLGELLDGSADIYQLDIDENEPVAEAQEVNGVPTFIIYKDGKEEWRQSGEIDGQELLARIQSYF
ncbi:MAG: thioredoxin family protein [Muribaculaceae bacterium]|nr:thioredoxin family protein [Muribaculaceae bacterium]MDE6532040.1 thioredoxin family protein [Muribaculaceae bacterium]MDE6771611.1 thioredoxin family protein [Muribaculaceae bacterium]